MTFFANKTTQRWDHVAYWMLMLAQSSFHIGAAPGMRPKKKKSLIALSPLKKKWVGRWNIFFFFL